MPLTEWFCPWLDPNKVEPPRPLQIDWSPEPSLPGSNGHLTHRDSIAMPRELQPHHRRGFGRE